MTLNHGLTKILAYCACLRLHPNNMQNSIKMLQLKNVTKHIEQLVKLNLIRDSLLPSLDGKPVYKVVDPRIIHMINCDVLEIE